MTLCKIRSSVLCRGAVTPSDDLKQGGALNVLRYRCKPISSDPEMFVKSFTDVLATCCGLQSTINLFSLLSEEGHNISRIGV